MRTDSRAAGAAAAAGGVAATPLATPTTPSPARTSRRSPLRRLRVVHFPFSLAAWWPTLSAASLTATAQVAPPPTAESV